MPLIILGLIFVIGLFVYYLFSTSSGKAGSKPAESPKQEDDLKREENVIFLPNDIEKAKQQHRKNK